MEIKTIPDIAELIEIGFCQQKFYKPAVWKEAVKIMECLANRTPFVIRRDFGRGKGKFDYSRKFDELGLSGSESTRFLVYCYNKLYENEKN